MRPRRVFTEFSILLLSLQPWLAVAQTSQQQPRWDGPGPWHMWGPGWGFGWIFPLLMFALMIFLCAFFMLRGPWSHGHRHGDTTQSALTLLNERFAKGEISKEEYEEKKAVLDRRA